MDRIRNQRTKEKTMTEPDRHDEESEEEDWDEGEDGEEELNENEANANLARPSHSRVRNVGFEAYAYDRGSTAFLEAGTYSELLIHNHRSGPKSGTWQFRFFPGDGHVQVRHFGESRVVIDYVETAEWQADPVAAATRFVGSAVAAVVAPELQMPVGDEVDQAMEKEWRLLRASLYAQDAELAPRSMDLLDHCWTVGAIGELQYREFHDRWTNTEWWSKDEPLHSWT